MDKIPFDPYDFFGYIASGLLFVIGLNLVIGFPKVLGQDLKLVDTSALILAIYVAGQILATPAKTLLEDAFVARVLKRPSINLLRRKAPILGRFLFPGFFKPLPEAIQRALRERVISQFGSSLNDESLFLSIRYSETVRKDEKLIQRLDSFRDKYGFARNLAFTSLLVGIGVLIKNRISPGSIDVRAGWTALVAGVFLFYRYLKFFRQYSYELFNCFASNQGEGIAVRKGAV